MKKFTKLATVLAVLLLLALSCFFACSNGADTGDVGNQGNGGSEQGNGGGSGNDGSGEQETPSLSDVASKSIAGYTTAETKTQAGNNVSDMLYLLDGGKFELYKNLSYEEYSGFALFAKGSYSGDILKDGKLTFEIEEEMDTTSLSEEEKSMLGLSSESAQTQNEIEKTARSVLVARSEIGDIISKLKALIKKLESIERKDVSSEGKSLQIKSDRDGLTVTDADNQEQKITASVSGVEINLEGFLLTGNPCHTVGEDGGWIWNSTESEGAIPLEKTSDGKYACTFITNDNDTVIRLIMENWKSQYGLLSVDIENSKMPNGAKITNDAEAVNVGHEEWQDPENIAIAGIEKGRKYDITFDTAKTLGKICIELKKHVITTLDGYMISGSMTTPSGEESWPGDEKGGARPLEKSGDKWTCSLTMNKDYNLFMLIKEGWTYELGHSQLDPNNKLFDNDREDDLIVFSDHAFNGTEKAILTFTVRSDGLIDIDCNIVYDEVDLNGLYVARRVSENNYELTIIKDNSVNILGTEYSLWIELMEKIDAQSQNVGYYDGTDCYKFKSFSRYDGSKDLPNGVDVYVDDAKWHMWVSGLTKNQNYTMKFDTKSKKGYFSVIIE